jgi:hypothetical protein
MPTRFGLLIACLLALPGCLERRMTITSEPPGATAVVNGVEIGRTPVSASFVYYGKYDVELQREGYETLRTAARAVTPIYEYPPVDLLASAVPVDISNEVRWHYRLRPELSVSLPRAELERGLKERAAAMRARLR